MRKMLTMEKQHKKLFLSKLDEKASRMRIVRMKDVADEMNFGNISRIYTLSIIKNFLKQHPNFDVAKEYDCRPLPLFCRVVFVDKVIKGLIES